MSAITVMAPTKAAVRMATKPERLTEPAEILPPKRSMTKATPRPAPLLIPKILGPAKGLRKAVCNISPLTANAPPQRVAVMACGSRDSRMMKRHEGLALSSPIRMLTTSPTGILTDPITRFSANSTMISRTIPNNFKFLLSRIRELENCACFANMRDSLLDNTFFFLINNSLIL